MEKIPKEYKAETLPEVTNEFWKDYQYGGPIQKLRPGIEVKESSSGGGQFKLGSFTITATGNISITGIGFKPKLVQFSYSATTGKGEGEMTSTEMRAYDPKTLGTLTINCIYIRDSANNVIARATYVSMDNDGFTINCSFTSASLVVYYTAFG